MLEKSVVKEICDMQTFCCLLCINVDFIGNVKEVLYCNVFIYKNMQPLNNEFNLRILCEGATLMTEKYLCDVVSSLSSHRSQSLWSLITVSWWAPTPESDPIQPASSRTVELPVVS